MTAHAPELATSPDSAGHSFARLPTGFVCDGCGFRLAAAAPVVTRCPAAVPGDNVDHVLRRTIDPTRLAFPQGSEPNPFIRFRTLYHAYHVARALGWPDDAYVELVERLDRAVATVDGHGFVVTPLADAADLGRRLERTGPLFVKDETGNVAGSHKARHLFGTALELEVAEALERSLSPAGATVLPARLAIASCGNAALAAAVVARAWGRTLDVFVPGEADPEVVRRLRQLGARVTVAPRRPGVPGDPSYRLLRRAVDDGAVPFTCQGNENGLAIEGGATLGYELVTGLRRAGARLDRLFVQVGGGALASSCATALEDALAFGVIDRMPRFHAVQSEGTQPLIRAYDRVAAHLRNRLDLGPRGQIDATPAGSCLEARQRLAELVRDAVSRPRGAAELARVAHHRSSFMWPWETAPGSVAGGILDDETYDWFAVVRAMLVTGGYPIAVSEATLTESNAVARSATGIDVDPTGSAGLAGLIDLGRAGLIEPTETVGVLFTGVMRRPPTTPESPTTPHPKIGEPR